MRGFALALGILGAVSLVIGILIAAGVIPLFGEAFTWVFWLVLSAVLFLSTIAVRVVYQRETE